MSSRQAAMVKLVDTLLLGSKNTLTHISFSIVSIVITIHLITFLVDEIVKLYDSSEKGIIVTFFCITGLLVTLIFLSWSFSLIHIIPYFKKNVLILSKITGPSAILTQGFATSVNNARKYDDIGLCSPFMWIVIFSSTSKQWFFNESFFLGENVVENTSLFCAKNYYQLIQQLDYWSYQVISLGFTFLTIGILSGAVWANEAWGSYWNWDPKETWAFITWIIFAIYLHTRTNRNLQGSNSAIVASIGFLIIWICYSGVNLLGIGLHSYGSFPSTFN
ncbi:hypothetical protein H5410_046572 [Solanum commersonii]|uniref:Cytochrome c assembly protein domain-containing protein n=1 Tax=Solanum commersonii TaxID=4109 RepID=A0A9J5XEN7_SOLCO|nr:hypothetical protein H5410_046572 [Solanum commersonii]